LVENNQANDGINDSMRNVRRIMNTIYQYKHSEVTRSDYTSRNQVWKRATELMPLIIPPEEFLIGTKRSGLAPFIVTRPENQKPVDVKVPESVE